MGLEEKLERKKLLVAKRAENQMRERNKLAMMSRKLRTKRLINAGGIVESAGLLDLDQDALTGALIEIYESSQQHDNLKRWHDLATQRHKERESENGTALIIQFDAKLGKELEAELKRRKFRYIPYREEWHGRGNKSEILKTFKRAQPRVEIVDTA